LLPLTTPTQNRSQKKYHTTDQTHITTISTSPNHRDKYREICNLLQAGVTIVENLGITNPEETPKDIIQLLQFISQKLTTTNPTHDMKATEKHLDTLSQQIESLTKAIPPQTKTK
jgi:type II secretory pathway component PulF